MHAKRESRCVVLSLQRELHIPLLAEINIPQLHREHQGDFSSERALYISTEYATPDPEFLGGPKHFLARLV